MIFEEDIHKIGTLTRVHALKGEVSLSFTDDVWDRAYDEEGGQDPYLILEMDGIFVPFFLEEWRFRSDSVALLKFEDIDTAEDAQELMGCSVYFPKALTPDDEPEDLRWSHFTGFQAYLSDGTLLGTITSVDESTANVLFTIETTQGEQLVPANEDFITDVDHAGRRITMDLPEGLLDL